MNEYATDEEQAEALKRWWAENWKSIAFGVVLAVGAVSGWKGWENHQREVGEAASDAYFSLLEAIEVADAAAGTESAEADQATITHLAGTLKSEHRKTVYAQYAALLIAKQAVLKNDLALAEQELQWVVDQADKDSSLYLISKLRLARVISASEDEEHALRALALIESQEAGSHTAAYEEVKGDIYLSLQRQADALAAYQRAIAEVERLGLNRPLLSIKADDLAMNGES